jgi:hypothetical protein
MNSEFEIGCSVAIIIFFFEQYAIQKVFVTEK